MEDRSQEEVEVESASSLVESTDLPTKGLKFAEDVCGHEKDGVFLVVESSLVPNREGTAEGIGCQNLVRAEAAVEDDGKQENCLWKDYSPCKASASSKDGNLKAVVSTEFLSASVKMVRQCLVEIARRINADDTLGGCHDNVELRSDDKWELFSSDMQQVCHLGNAVKSMFMEYEETRKRDKKELENSILSLTEENRDTGDMLRVALAEKDSLEKSLNKLREGGEQKRMAILQIAERGLQKVGFSFMIGSSGGECTSDNPGSSNASTKSDGSDEEEESVSLANTVQTIMKNLRLEIVRLRKALEDSRSDFELLQSLTEKQAHEINESTCYIKVLEERENLLNQNIVDLNMKIKEAEEEILRWREACELEVEAGKSVIQEHVRKSAILQGDLERTKNALDDANKKQMLKERLATTAMAAQAAAETSLRMADSRSVLLRERIEELTKQLEEESEHGGKQKGGSRQKIRHFCWPWQAFKIISPSISRGRNQNRGRRIPEMLALLQ